MLTGLLTREKNTCHWTKIECAFECY